MFDGKDGQGPGGLTIVGVSASRSALAVGVTGGGRQSIMYSIDETGAFKVLRYNGAATFSNVSMMLINGSLFGATYLPGNGSVYSVKPDGTGFQFVHLFTGPPSDGLQPISPPILSKTDGRLYGTTELGGASQCPGLGSCGMVYSITP
jgi:hypothetical protein